MKSRLVIVGLCIGVLTGCGGGGSSDGTVNNFIYKFDETSGSTAVNSTANLYNGTIYGANRVTGKIGNALHFGSSGARVEITLPTNGEIRFDNNTLSIDSWINLDSIAAGSVYQIVGDGYYGSKSFVFQLNNGKLQMLLYAGSGYQTLITGSQTLSPNTWYHIAVTYDGTTATTYVDGSVDNTNNITSKILTVYNTLYIATTDSDVNSGTPYQNQLLGTIDELRISKSCRTAAEINSYYQTTK